MRAAVYSGPGVIELGEREECDGGTENDSSLQRTMISVFATRDAPCTYHKTSACAEHEHWPSSVQPTLLVEAVVTCTGQEDVGDTQTQTADEEIERCTAERYARLRRTLDRVTRERLVGAVVDLPPLSYSDR